MELTIKDRLQIMSILPTKASLQMMKAKTSLLKKIEFTGEELEELGIDVDRKTGLISWNGEKAKTINLEFSEEEKKLLNESIDKTDSNESVTEDMLETIEKIKGSS